MNSHTCLQRKSPCSLLYLKKHACLSLSHNHNTKMKQIRQKTKTEKNSHNKTTTNAKIAYSDKCSNQMLASKYERGKSLFFSSVIIRSPRKQFYSTVTKQSFSVLCYSIHPSGEKKNMSKTCNDDLSSLCVFFFLLSNSSVLSLFFFRLPPSPHFPSLASRPCFLTLICLLVERLLLAFCRRRSLIGADIRIDKTKVSSRVIALF